MYTDYSTDASYPPSSDYDRDRRTATPPTSSAPGSSYQARTTSKNQNTAVNGNGTTSSPNLRAHPLPSSPKDPSLPMNGTPPRHAGTSSPFSASPRPSEEIIAPAGGLPHPQLRPLQRQNSVTTTTSTASDRILTQYAPSVDLSNAMDDGPNGFDEGVLRALCDLDCGVPLLLDRIKQSMVSCREVSMFFKKRAVVEDEYGRILQKTARMSHETYAMNDGKAGTFVSAWQSTMKLHDVIADNRLKFGARLNEMSEELNTLAKEVERNRKAAKELASRYEKGLTESESALEKAKQRVDTAHEELERALLASAGESKDAGTHPRSGPPGKRVLGKAVAKGGMLLKGKNPAAIQKQLEDARNKVSSCSDAFKKAVQETQTMRQEYFNFQLPRILRTLKECADEIDLGTQYHLSRYAFLFESTVLNDGSILVPTGGIEDGPGLKPLIESIDNRQDFKVYMQNYAIAKDRPVGPRREGAWEDGFLPPLPKHYEPAGAGGMSHSQTSASLPTAGSSGAAQRNGTPPPNGMSSSASYPAAIMQAMAQHPDRGRPTFGVPLEEQMVRDGVEVPRIVEKCCEAIETYGLRSVGIYRISGMTSKVQKLKMVLDRDLEGVDLLGDEWKLDVNNVSSVLKLWFRELPEPLLTFPLYQGFIEAAKAENERLRHIQLHHKVNDLPDANYAALKYLIGHLHKVREYESVNSMSASNLAIVFGPTLLGPPPGEGSTTLQDMNWQCKAIETIIEHYVDIFVDDAEAAAP